MAAEFKGIPDFKAKLAEIPKALRRRVLRNALSAGARVVRDDAKRRAPILKSKGSPYRAPGTVRDAIRVRTSKQATAQGEVGVFVNVKPLPGAKFKTKIIKSKLLGISVRQRTLVRASQRGAKNPNDPFYWRFLEFGTKKMSARSFLRPAAAKLGQALGIFNAEVVRWINKVNNGGQIK